MMPILLVMIAMLIVLGWLSMRKEPPAIRPDIQALADKMLMTAGTAVYDGCQMFDFGFARLHKYDDMCSSIFIQDDRGGWWGLSMENGKEIDLFDNIYKVMRNHYHERQKQMAMAALHQLVKED